MSDDHVDGRSQNAAKVNGLGPRHIEQISHNVRVFAHINILNEAGCDSTLSSVCKYRFGSKAQNLGLIPLTAR